MSLSLQQGQDSQLPSHNHFFRTVLSQQGCYQAFEATESFSDRPIIKYRLNLGLKGWTVKQTILTKEAASQQDWHYADQNVDHTVDQSADHSADQSADHRSRESLSSAEEEEEKQTNLMCLRNSAIAEKDQALLQGLDILHSRLQASQDRFKIYQIKTPQHILCYLFSRRCLSSVYGGHLIGTFSTINKESEYKQMMCINLLYNPHGPQFPGAPGLYYALRDPGRWPKTKEIVISRYGPNKWNYMGIYDISKCKPLSPTEFAMLGKNVQNTWFESIWSHKWGDYTLAGIYLRRQHQQEPRDEEVAFYAKKKVALLHRKVTREDVKRAFFAGEERINVWRMECVDYDEDFKRPLVPVHSVRQMRACAPEKASSNPSKSAKRGATSVGRTLSKRRRL